MKSSKGFDKIILLIDETILLIDETIHEQVDISKYKVDISRYSKIHFGFLTFIRIYHTIQLILNLRTKKEVNTLWLKVEQKTKFYLLCG